MELFPIIVVALVFSGFFSGIEIAFISANKFRIELGNKQGLFSARILSKFAKQPSQFIGTLLVGNNIALVVYGIFMAELMTPIIKSILPAEFVTETTLLVLQTIVSTLVILVTGEFIPKALFRINPNKMLQIFTFPILIFYVLLYPVVYVIKVFSETILKKFFKVDNFEAELIFGRLDLDHYVREINTEQETESGLSSEIQMFQNALDFNSVKVREAMIPRTEIVAINKDNNIEELRKMFIETGLSKILVYQDSIENIIGFVHSYEMFKKPVSISSIILPITIIPETMPARELLTLFTQQHKSISLVVDEYGGTAGIVTMEDVMEEIFGEIDDEHDIEDLTEKKLNENEYILSGRLEIDYLNQEYGLDLPVGEEYETLAGLIMHFHKSIPLAAEEIQIPGFGFKILQVTETRIDQVKMTLSQETE